MTGAPHSSVKRYRELARTPTRNGRERELLLDGTHLLFEARAAGLAVESAAFQYDTLNDPAVRALAEQLAAEGADVFIVSRKILEAMSPVKTPTGAVGIARRTVQTLEGVVGTSRPLVPLIVVAHDVQDPGNVGGILRTAEAAAATGFIASAATADPFGWRALRGSMGSALRLPIARADIDDTLSALRDSRVTTTALVPRGGQPLFTSDFRNPLALFLGGEGYGLPEEVSHRMDRLDLHPDARPGRVAERRRRGRARAV